MRETTLHDWHVSHGATMTDFNGWHMPLYYKGITEEHNHTRTKAGLFDLGHMGRVMLRGAKAREFVDYLTPARVSEAQTGDVQYSFLLRENGTVIDDITIYYDEDYILLVINAGNRDRDIAWIKEQAAKFGGVDVENLSDSWGMIALQGPKSDLVMKKLFGPATTFPGYYKFARFDDTVAPGPVIISGTGYTGEHGYEIYLPSEHCGKLWEALAGCEPTAEVAPIGLGARDSLRLEASMPLYGHELDDNTTPLHAGLNKFVNLDKPSFIGRDALLKVKADGPAQKLTAFEITQRGPIARQGFNVVSEAGDKIGTVTSGIFSPTLQKTVGMAYVKPEFSKIGTAIQIEVRGKLLPATIIKRPFYRRNA
jgi:glycine cleavage system T protein